MAKTTAFFVISLLCLLLKNSVESLEVKKYLYEIKEFQVPVDHFNYANNKTFALRYLYNDSFVHKDGNSPLFFYTGNEGDIELFAQNTGFMWELAEQMKACVVFAEHRYYGKSQPFGDETYNRTENIGYLSVEQVLEDFADLITFMKAKRFTPTIAFGGSYGGMLAAWLRMKYPHLVLGSLAASAPIRQFNGITPCDIYNRITTSVFDTAYSENCTANIRESWNMFRNVSSTDDGKKKLTAMFKFCNPIKSADDLNLFFDFLEDVYGNLAMANYPYDNEFLAPLPAYPVREFCLHLKDNFKGMDLLNAMKDAISLYTNYTGIAKCVDYKSAYNDNLGGKAWLIQTCNQIVMPMCSNSEETMFRDKSWDFKAYSDNCNAMVNIRPKLNDITLRYGGKSLEYASNIIFSNGLLDPWSGGGVLQTDNDNIVVIIIPEGAHHLDLRQANPLDPRSVLEARKQESHIIAKWLADEQ